MLQVKTYRYKLRPTRAQQQTLGQWLGACRYIYNLTLDYKKTLWEQCRVNIGKYEIQKELTVLVKDFSWMESVYSATRIDVTDRVFTAYDNFFKHGKGFPQFARKGEYQSFTFKQDVKIDATHVQLPKLGKVRYRNSQPCLGKIKRATVRECIDGWYVSLVVETNIEPLPLINKHIGIDVGIKSLLVTSEGETIVNPKHFYKAERKLKRLQRSVSRKKKGGNNRKKAVQKLARHHQRVANTRKDFQHKLTTRLIRENQAIAIESLRIQNMLANHQLAKAISDAGWYSLTQMLTYKAKWYGRTLERVSARYTSQDCSTCGYRNTDLTLAVRAWVCPSCGTTHDRDINAAKNIKSKAAGSAVSAWEAYAPVTAVTQESFTQPA
ncbi:RNA-guided endonuclease InsQ/TnpB family protein [Fibrella sp. WM1]|uniref:RNA-guided endonuclease InsQ/TnpB family protein n=1 Tax=Fibrella musci TaxID=3242485 RepID=UPI003522E6BE